MVMNIVRFMSDEFNVAFNLRLEFRLQFISVRSQVIMIILVRIKSTVFL